ncbi:hypothetical protein BP6252_04978 [Coleophoma cylindrospora]|uniref:Xylanolytic transcriptional activator regulatory domain-containing protein n=1 Tax=Coleophoma cylindrospora TaxID=1849047 RepID=A0A3D8RSF3_9HELO|nr:hypothetical protein BP6252_04978 [Coleophoma cylindrospora]
MALYRFINNLQRRIEAISRRPQDETRLSSPIAVDGDPRTPMESGNPFEELTPGNQVLSVNQEREDGLPAGSHRVVHPDADTDGIGGAQSIDSPGANYEGSSGCTTPEPSLCNPLSDDRERYVSDSTGKPWYLGTSSNWSFARRVLSMAHERVYSLPLPAKDLSFDGKIYDIGWDGLRSPFTPEFTALPSSDYAIYLINAVKFHCGQMFHLFDEQSFMQKFTEFHQTSAEEQHDQRSDLWFIHYLLILAFGKAFTVRSNAGHSPPGADLFVWALKCLPSTVYMCAQSVESVEILCCVALYLQSLDFRCSAYNYIGQALRSALALGMHTSMEKQGLGDHFVQRCRNSWWTVYVLDRQMSSLMGVPLGVQDDDVAAFLPTFPESRQRTLALEIHVKLSRIISQILTTVYGRDGRLSRKYLNCTKTALKNIATVTDQLNQHFDIPVSTSMAGISRLSAYLHLLYHQCIVLTTRPLFFSCFKMRLDAPNIMPLQTLGSTSARVLLQMCLESSNQILNVLSGLQRQSLLESFLPFDLEGAFVAALIIILAPAVDPLLSENPQQSLRVAYNALDEMAFRGNIIAATRKSELHLLEDLLSRIPFSAVAPSGTENDASKSHAQGKAQAEHNQIEGGFNSLDMNGLVHNVVPVPTDPEILASEYWSHELGSEQLLALADSLELDGIDWMTMSDSNYETNLA